MSGWPTFISDNTKKVFSRCFLLRQLLPKTLSFLRSVSCGKLHDSICACPVFSQCGKYQKGNLVSPSETQRHEFKDSDNNHGFPLNTRIDDKRLRTALLRRFHYSLVLNDGRATERSELIVVLQSPFVLNRPEARRKTNAKCLPSCLQFASHEPR